LRRLYREDSQRRKTRRSTGAAADQVRDGNQSQDRRGARHQNLRQFALTRRRGDRVRRRAFITLLGGAAAWPLAARAQQAGGKRRIGVLMNIMSDDPESQIRLAAFAQGLQQLVGSSAKMSVSIPAGALAILRILENIQPNWSRSARMSSWPIRAQPC